MLVGKGIETNRFRTSDESKDFFSLDRSRTLRFAVFRLSYPIAGSDLDIYELVSVLSRWLERRHANTLSQSQSQSQC
eukprot:418236-Hanusia_phi.AAC.1